VNPNDVLCGRGGATNSHAGNRSYRELVKKYKDKYLQAKKKQKPNVAAEVVDIIRTLDPPGRFLKKDKDTGFYLDIGDPRAKEKTSQALREGAPLIRKQMSDAKKGGDQSSDDGTSPDKSTPSPPGSEEDRKISGDATISAFSPMQQSIVNRDLESAAQNPDNSDNVAATGKPDREEETIEQSKKRPSPMKEEESEESPSKRQMKTKDEDLPKKDTDPYRDVFDPPRAPIRKEDDED